MKTLLLLTVLALFLIPAAGMADWVSAPDQYEFTSFSKLLVAKHQVEVPWGNTNTCTPSGTSLTIYFDRQSTVRFMDAKDSVSNSTVNGEATFFKDGSFSDKRVFKNVGYSGVDDFSCTAGGSGPVQSVPLAAFPVSVDVSWQ